MNKLSAFYIGIRQGLSNSKQLVRFSTCIQVLCLMLIAGLPGCKKDFDFDKVKSQSWNPDVAVALVNDSITLRKILTEGGAEGHVNIDESGLVSILYYYNNNAFRLRPGSLIKLAPVSLSFLHQITQAEQSTLLLSDLTIPPVPLSFPLSVNNPEIRVDKLLIKKGKIKVNTNHTFNNNGYLTIRFLNATKNGIPFSFDSGPFVTGQTNTDVDVSGVLFDLTSTPNTIQVEIGGLVKKSGRPVTGDEIRASFQISIDTIKKFEGFLGHQTFAQLTDTVVMNVFNNAYTLGELYFEDPQATITIVNSIGVPSEITVEKMIAMNNTTGSSMDIADRLGSGAVFQVPSPLINATQSSVKTMYYTNDNTGNAMHDFFNLKPENIAFQVKTVINPTGTPLNFFTDTSSFYGDLRVKLPLYGHFDHLTFQDTFDLVIDKPEEIEHLEFRTKISNGLPLTALMQIYFTDENYNKKDSLTGDNHLLIWEAPVDPATHLPYPNMYGEKDTIFILNLQRMQNLEHVKKMLVKAVLHSAEEGKPNVKLKADQSIRLHFSARATLKKNIQPSK